MEIWKLELDELVNLEICKLGNLMNLILETWKLDEFGNLETWKFGNLNLMNL